MKVLDTPNERNKGFNQYSEENAVLLIFDNEAVQAVSATDFPINLYFYTSDLELVKRVESFSEGKVYSDEPVKYILEQKV